MNDISQKCPHCHRYYLIIPGEDRCPFCGKKANDIFNPFKDIFGGDNPFSNLGAV